MYKSNTKNYERITEELSKLNIRPIDLDFDYDRCAREFGTLPKIPVIKDSRRRWGTTTAKDRGEKHAYDVVVESIALALGYPAGQRGFNAWHMILERDSPLCNGIYIRNASKASARHCELLKAKIYEIRRNNGLEDRSGNRSKHDGFNPIGQARGHVDRKAAFRDLEKPLQRLSEFHYRGLTELQTVCLKLKYEYELSAEKIGKRIGRSKATVQGILKTANNKIAERMEARVKEKSRST